MLRTHTEGIHGECDLCQLKIREKNYLSRITRIMVVHIIYLKGVKTLLENECSRMYL